MGFTKNRFPTFYGYQRFIREAILENIGFPIFDLEDLESLCQVFLILLELIVQISLEKNRQKGDYNSHQPQKRMKSDVQTYLNLKYLLKKYDTCRVENTKERQFTYKRSSSLSISILLLDAKYLLSGMVLHMLDASQSSNNLHAPSDQRKLLAFYTKSHRQRMKNSYRKFKNSERKTYEDSKSANFTSGPPFKMLIWSLLD